MVDTPDREIEELRALIGSDRDPEGRAFAPLADALRRSGSHDEALEVLADGLERHPSFTSGHVVAGRIHRDRGETDRAVTAFRRVLDLDGDNVMALHGLGRMLVVRGESEEAGRLLSRAAELGYTTDLVEEGPQMVPREETAGLRGERPEEGPEATPGEGGPDAGGAVGAGEPSERREPAEAAGRFDGIGELTLRSQEGEDGETAEAEAVADVGEFEGADQPDEVLHDEEPGKAEEGDEAGPEEGEEPAEAADVAEQGAAGAAEVSEVFEAEEVEVAEPLEVAGASELQEVEEVVEVVDVEGPRTRTMAELYVRQGMPDRAVRVYEHLVAQRPDDEEIRARFEELRDRVVPPEGGDDTLPPALPGEPEAWVPEIVDAGLPTEQELEAVALGMTESGHSEPVESPFSWTDREVDEPAEGASGRDSEPVSSYFAALRAYEPGGGRTAGPAHDTAREPEDGGAAALDVGVQAPADPEEDR